MHAVTTPVPNTIHFNEEQWMPILFLLADTQTWLQQLHEELLYQLPIKNRKKLLRQSWYLSVNALAHILERHYHKVPRHPLTGKFTIPIPAIVAAIKDAAQQPPAAVPQSTTRLQRVWQAPQPVGYDCKGAATRLVTVIADMGGRIVTAFPGELHPL